MRRLIPLLAVLFALAAGIALGAGPLDDRRGSAADSTGHRPVPATRFDDAFAGAVAPSLYGQRLANQSVAIVTTPGVSEATATGVSEQVVAAGGTVTGTTALTEALTGAGQKTLVDTMGTQLATQLKAQLPALADPALSTYPRMGKLLGVALGTLTAATPAPEAAVSTVRESLHAAKLTGDIGANRVAPLVIVLLGDDIDDAILTGLVQGVASQTQGVVVAGPSRSEDVARIAEGTGKPAVATVDGVETGAGRVAAVLALVKQVTGGGGSFGASGIDGPIPVG